MATVYEDALEAYKVYIIGAGPGARLGAAEAALNDCPVIAGNYGAVAALSAGIQGGTWLVADPVVWQFDWAWRTLVALRHDHGWNLGVSACTNTWVPDLVPDWTFEQEPAAGLGDGALMDGVLRCGGTVAAQMVQLACQRKYTKIILCGCHLTGPDYWDGRKVYGELGEWPQKPTFDAFCDSAMQNGLEVVHFDHAIPSSAASPADFAGG